MDYILNGTSIRTVNGKRVVYKHGLRFIKSYRVEFFTLNARTAGLPHKRNQVFIVMVRKDAKNLDAAFVLLEQLFHKVKMNPLTPSPLSAFVTPEIPMQHVWKKARKERFVTSSPWANS